MTKTSFDALVEVLGVLKSLEIQHMLVGSFSSNVYSFPRSTKDADIEILYSKGDLQRIRDRLDDNFALDLQMSFETITGTVRNVLTFKPKKFDIELFRLGDDPHHRERFARKRTATIPTLGIEAIIPTPEDVIIQKLRWHREIDIADARNVLQVQYARLDWKYLCRWTDEHGTAELLAQLREECKFA